MAQGHGRWLGEVGQQQGRAARRPGQQGEAGAHSNAVQGRARAAHNEQQHDDGVDTMNRVRKLAERVRTSRARALVPHLASI